MEYLTTRELVNLLSKADPEGNRRIILSADEEGNTFGYLELDYSFRFEKGVVILYPVDTFTADDLEYEIKKNSNL